jgi:uncharacterized protein involved in exopolysaccharide biosynthesis
LELDASRIRHDAQVNALQAELHAAKVQLEAQTQLANDRSTSVRDLEILYASKHREAKELADSVAGLEQQVCRDKAELNKLRQDKMGASTRGVGRC